MNRQDLLFLRRHTNHVMQISRLLDNIIDQRWDGGYDADAVLRIAQNFSGAIVELAQSMTVVIARAEQCIRARAEREQEPTPGPQPAAEMLDAVPLDGEDPKEGA